LKKQKMTVSKLLPIITHFKPPATSVDHH